MLFSFGPHSSLLLPFVVPGLVAALWLLGRAWRRGAAADALLALLILLLVLNLSQWMLGYAGWFDSHDGYSTVMFYVPWHLGLLTGPTYYLYFRSLTNQEFRWRPLVRHLLPGLLEAGLFAVVAVYDLGWWRGLNGRALPDFFGTKGAAATWRDGLNTPLTLIGYALLLGYGLWMRADYRRYRRYLDDNFSDAERLRFAGLRQLLVLQVISLGLGLLFTALNQHFNFSYDAAWYFFVLRGTLIYGLIAVGLQANYAAATSPLRFDAPAELPADVVSAEAAAPLMASGAAENRDEAPAELVIILPTTDDQLPNQAATELPPELLLLRDRLLHLMSNEQPWLEPELNLTELAHRLRTNPTVLSKVINMGCGQNFNDFVNGYRVRAAAQRLAEARFSHYSLMGVALDCGFNSKSTFNRVFKKLAGYPPSEVTRPKS